MNKDKATIIQSVFLSIFISLFIANSAYSGDYAALDGLHDIKVVFDVRSKKLKSAAIQLDLIHQTYQDKNIRAVTDHPDFVVVFGGPAVTFFSTNTRQFKEDERFLLGRIADKLSVMAKDGIKFEICLFAADLFDVEPETILPEIKHIPNGWISLIGYQAKGHNLVAAF